MSLQTVADFIRPFANALNLLNVPNLNHTESQTAYVPDQNNVDYTPLIESYEKGESLVKIVDDSNFEKQILHKLQENLIADLTRSESESEVETVESVQEVVEFGERDEVQVNESLADASSLPDVSSDESKNARSESNDSVVSSQSVDEGVGDLTKLSPPRCMNAEPDERVVKIGQIIFDYMSEQGFEDSDLVIFPELLHDGNTAKLIVKLGETYQELYGDQLTSEERSDLRIVICSYVLNLIEKDDRMTSSLDSLDFPMVSDKLFSVSETLSAIMDHFFDSVDSNQERQNQSEKFGEFVDPIKDVNGNIHHSTPDPFKINSKDETYEIVEEVTSFKRDKKQKPGHESYWFSIGSPQKVVREVPTVKKIVNVDDIPLPPPRDLDYFDESKNNLSPIPEEANRNLIFDFLEEEKTRPSVDILAGGDGDKIETILSGRGSCSYVAFDQPETNVVVCSAVSFCRTITTVSSAYVKSDSVVFTKSSSVIGNGDESFYSVSSTCSGDGGKKDEDEGDWMGFETAKF
jgi:hypothetical protein